MIYIIASISIVIITIILGVWWACDIIEAPVMSTNKVLLKSPNDFIDFILNALNYYPSPEEVEEVFGVEFGTDLPDGEVSPSVYNVVVKYIT